MKKAKKILSVLLAVLIIALISCPAFAENDGDTSTPKKLTLIFHLEGPVYHKTDNGLEPTDKTYCGILAQIYGNPCGIYDLKTNEPISLADSTERPKDFVVVYDFKPWNPDADEEDRFMEIQRPDVSSGAINVSFYHWIPQWWVGGNRTKSGFGSTGSTLWFYESELDQYQPFEFFAEYTYSDVEVINLNPTSGFFDAIANFFRSIIERIELFFAMLFGFFSKK